MTLRRANDWGVEYLSPDPLDERGQANLHRSVRIAEGALVDVLWPDGTITFEIVSLRKTVTRVSDMRHDYEVTSHIPGITAVVHGAAVWIPLDTKGLQVRTRS